MTTTFDLQALAGRVGISVTDRSQTVPEALQTDPEPTPTRTQPTLRDGRTYRSDTSPSETSSSIR